MRIRHVMLGILCLCTFAVYAQECQFSIDGTKWKGLSTPQKIAFLYGYSYGFGTATGDFQNAMNALPQYTAKQTRKLLDDDSPDNATVKAIMDGVDACYSDFRNANLIVPFCITWALQGIRGDSDKQREHYLEVARILTNQNQHPQ